MATKLLFSALAAITGTLALSSSLTLVSAPASAFEIERGSHGASRIVPTKKSTAATPQQKTKPQDQEATTETAPRRSRLVRGPHGAQRLVTQ